MSLVPRRASASPGEEDAATLVQGLEQEVRRASLRAQAARWRAGALAEAIFGDGVVPRVRYARGAAGFQALVELEVPFEDLERHRAAEHRFVHEAGRDEVLSRIPTLFVFTPRSPDPAHGGGGR